MVGGHVGGPVHNGPEASPTTPRLRETPSTRLRPGPPRPPSGLVGPPIGQQKSQGVLLGSGQLDPDGPGYMPSQVDFLDGRTLCNLGIGQRIFVRGYKGFQILYMGFAHELVSEITKLVGSGG